MKIKIRYITMIIVAILLFFMILPGIMFVDIFFHELFHIYKNYEYAEKLCFDISYPFVSHTLVSFPNQTVKDEYIKDEYKQESKQADRFGLMASFIYLIIAALILLWFLHVARRYEEK